MLKLYKKSELGFSLVWIGIYCIAMSVADNISAEIGITSVISLPVISVLSLALTLFIFRNGLNRKYGLCKPHISSSKALFYLPLAALLTVNLWYGITLNLSPAEAALYILTMLGVGFFEEVLFRGLLFNAMLKDSYAFAVTVSSISFGFGHIINLFNGSGMSLTENIIQVVSAVAIGFMFVTLYRKSASLLVCILTHALFNSLSVFSNEAVLTPQKRIISGLFIVLLCIAYTAYLSLKIKNDAKENTVE